MCVCAVCVGLRQNERSIFPNQIVIGVHMSIRIPSCSVCLDNLKIFVSRLIHNQKTDQRSWFFRCSLPLTRSPTVLSPSVQFPGFFPLPLFSVGFLNKTCKLEQLHHQNVRRCKMHYNKIFENSTLLGKDCIVKCLNFKTTSVK